MIEKLLFGIKDFEIDITDFKNQICADKKIKNDNHEICRIIGRDPFFGKFKHLKVIIDGNEHLIPANTILELEDKKNRYKIDGSCDDIIEHLPILEEYASKCDVVTEFGVRTGCSTLSFIQSRAKKIISYDIDECINYSQLKSISNENKNKWFFNRCSSLETEIDHTDLLFIDSLHTYEQLINELSLHAKKVRKYIILHDTESFGECDEIQTRTEKKGLRQAIHDFLSSNTDFVIDKIFTNNNGLTILKNISNKNDKYIFYHLYPKNDYIKIHNSLFSKIKSNPFFDDAMFIFTIVGDEKDVEWDRLIQPKRVEYFYEKNSPHQSESPCFMKIKHYVEQEKIKDDDFVFYFHCKGSSQPGLIDWSEHVHKSIHSKHAINEWNDVLSYFLIENIQLYQNELIKYGTLGAYPIYRFGDKKIHIAGTTGNFWWAMGDVIKNITKIINLDSRPRLYYEYECIRDILQISSREYKYMYYVSDGPLSVYTLTSPNRIGAVNNLVNSEFNDLINFALPTKEPNIKLIIYNEIIKNSFDLNAQTFKSCTIDNNESSRLITIHYFGNKNLHCDFIHNVAREYKNKAVYDPYLKSFIPFIYDKDTIVVPYSINCFNNIPKLDVMTQYDMGIINKSKGLIQDYQTYFSFKGINYKIVDNILIFLDNNDKLSKWFVYLKDYDLFYGFGESVGSYGDCGTYIQVSNKIGTLKKDLHNYISCNKNTKNDTLYNFKILYGSDTIWIDITQYIGEFVLKNGFIYNNNHWFDLVCKDPCPGVYKKVKFITQNTEIVIDSNEYKIIS